MIKVFKILTVFLFSLVIYLTINSDLSFASSENTFTTLIFSMFTAMIMVLPKLKRIGIYISIVLWIFTTIFFVTGYISKSNITGTLAFGFLIIFLVLNMSELVKKGRLEKL